VNLEVTPEEDFTQDDDPFDSLLDGPELGILVRTDYSNDDAWDMFCTTLRAAEQGLAEASKRTESEEVAIAESNQAMSTSEERVDDSDSDMESLDGPPSPIIKILDPSPLDRPVYNDMSNLSALRLFNDVDIRQAPAPPTGSTPIQPSNRLIDHGGWQEIYSGMTIWIYDGQSNIDQSIRLVSQEGDVYGTATGDSWRVQASHICELQFDMSFLGMKINFGGLDRWDFVERQRNLNEAHRI